MRKNSKPHIIHIIAISLLLIISYGCESKRDKKELCDLIELSIVEEDYHKVIEYADELKLVYPNCLIYSLEEFCTYYNLNTPEYDSLLIYKIDNSSDSLKHTFESTFVKALVYARKEEYKNAIGELDKILTAEELINILALKGHLYYSDNQFKKSIEVYDKILKKNLPLEFGTNIYYLRIYSKYKINDIVGAIWDCAVMEDYGLMADEDLLVKVANDSLSLDDIKLLNYSSINAKSVISNFR